LLRAVALEMIGDVEAAETELLAAESLDSDWAPVLYDLARYASDRGDVERGLSLLRRAGRPVGDVAGTAPGCAAWRFGPQRRVLVRFGP